MKTKWQCSRRRYEVVSFAVLTLAIGAGCSSGVDENFERSEEFTTILSNTDLQAPSDLGGLQGTAVFEGPGVLTVDGFEATADTQLVADFDSATIAGSMTNFTDRDSRRFKLRGDVVIYDGAIAGSGSFAAQMAGNLERRGFQDVENSPELTVFSGTASGQLYDGLDGQSGTKAVGAIAGATIDGGSVEGSFVVQR